MKIFVLMIIMFIAGVSCAEIYLVPDLPQRALHIDSEKPGLFYPHSECGAHFLGICTKQVHKIDSYDLNDPAIRHKLNDMNFLCRVADKH